MVGTCYLRGPAVLALYFDKKSVLPAYVSLQFSDQREIFVYRNPDRGEGAESRLNTTTTHIDGDVVGIHTKPVIDMAKDLISPDMRSGHYLAESIAYLVAFIIEMSL